MYDISKLDWWVGRETDVKRVSDWRKLLLHFGEALLPFLVDEKYIIGDQNVGEKIWNADPRLGQFRKDTVELPRRLFKTYPGAAWVLMAYGDAYNLPAPFSRDGFLLPLEWRKAESEEGRRHSDLLPPSLLALADKVKRQFAEAGLAVDDYHLHPWRGFDGKVDFSKINLGKHADGRDDDFDSAWGALATGLYSIISAEAAKPTSGHWLLWIANRLGCRFAKDGVLADWPFSTIAFDFDACRPKSVSRLDRKIAVVASYGGREVAAAPNQRSELKAALDEFNPEHGVNIRQFDWKWRKDDLRGSLRALAQCNQLRTAKKVLNVALTAGVVLACLVGGMLYAWDQTRDIVEYYADYANEWGIPEGIDRISQQESRLRWRHFEVVYHKSRWKNGGVWIPKKNLYLYSLNYCNSEGSLCPYDSPIHDSTRVARRVFEADKDGILNCVYYQDENGQDITKVFVSSGNVFDLWAVRRPGRRDSHQKGLLVGRYGIGDRERLNPFPSLSAFLGSGDYSDERSRVVVQSRTAKGLPRTLLYYPNNRSRKLANGVVGEYGVECSYDDLGRLTEGRFLSKLGMPRQVTNAVAGVAIFYGPRTNEITYVDSLGVPQTNRWGWVRRRTVFGEHGRPVETSYVGPDGRPMYGPNGYAKEEYDYDPAGHRRETRFKDHQGRLAYSDAGYAVVRIEKIDSQGYASRMTYWGIDGKPCLTRQGFARIDCLREKDRLVVWCYNEKGEPWGNDGVCERVTYLDGGNRISKVLFYGPRHTPVLSFDYHVHGVEFRYRQDGLLDQCRMLGLDGETTMLANGVWGLCRTDYELTAGTVSRITTRHYGKDENTPVVFNGLPMVQEFDIDAFGNVVGMSNVEPGCSAYQKYTYDECGRIILMEDFESDRRTYAKGKKGPSVLKLEYDEDGLPRSFSYYGSDYSESCPRLMMSASGFARFEPSDYTIFGKPQREDAYDAERRLLFTQFTRYDHLGREIETWTEDENGKPVLRGQAERVKYEYNLRGDRIAAMAYRHDGTKTLGRLGYHKVVWEYNNCGQLLREYYEDCAGKRASDVSSGIVSTSYEYENGLLSRMDKETTAGLLSQWVRHGILFSKAPDRFDVDVTCVGWAGDLGMRLVCAVDGVRCFGNSPQTVELLSKEPTRPKNILWMEARFSPGGGWFSEVKFELTRHPGMEALSAGRPRLKVEIAHLLYDKLEAWCREQGVVLCSPYPGVPDFKW